MHINTHQPTPTPQRRAGATFVRARCSQPLSTNQTPHPTTKVERQHATPSQVQHHPRFPNQQGKEVTGLLSQSPIVCLAASPERPTSACCVHQNLKPTTGQAHPTNRCTHRTPTHCGRAMGLVVLLRKEVIQPHLPVRLPCYDFVPIADPTFDRSLPYGLGHGLRVLPTFMT